MEQTQPIIGLSAGLSPAPFIQALTDALLATVLPNGVKPQVETACLEVQKPVSDDTLVVEGNEKIHTFDEVEYLIKEGCTVIGIGNFSNLTFLNELQTEVTTPVANIGIAAAKAIEEEHPVVGYLGIPGTKKAAALTQSMDEIADISWVYPSEPLWKNIEYYHDVMQDKRSEPEQKTEAFEVLLQVAKDLVAQGATLIMPSCGYQAVEVKRFAEHNLKMIDVVSAYAQYLALSNWKPLPKPFKVGLVGGLGPAATVDLYDKITKATPAKTDQEHFKVVVEQNPQIADRTAYLLHGGYDPTLSLYSVCKKLEADGVDAIIIPCNTAHAFFESIVPHLSVPLINMQQTALEEIRDKLGPSVVIGLLATDGTIKTGIYSKKAESMGFSIVVPDAPYQAMVMESIYGPKGAKAGFTDGECKESLLRAAEHLAKEKGAKALILGCTELPLILSEADDYDLNGVTVTFVDPTASLARRVVVVGQEITKIRGRR